MNRILLFIAVIGAFSLLPVSSASAYGHGHAHGHSHGHVHGHVVVHGGVRVHGFYGRPGYRCGPVVYRRPVYRVYGPRYCYPRPWGIGIGIRI